MCAVVVLVVVCSEAAMARAGLSVAMGLAAARRLQEGN